MEKEKIGNYGEMRKKNQMMNLMSGGLDSGDGGGGGGKSFDHFEPC
jgi:hypothetical protein